MRSTLGPFALLEGGDAWSRSSHDGTFLSLAQGVVELAWRAPDEGEAPDEIAPIPGGLAFDAECRLYRSDPAAGTIERSLWAAGTPFAAAEPIELFASEPAPEIGDFAPAAQPAGPLAEPRGLAVDVDDRLFIAESEGRRVLVFDLWSRRLLRVVPTPPGTRPLDVAVHGRTVFVVLAGSSELMRLTARDEQESLILPPEAIAPTRVAVSEAGEIVVLVGAGTDDACIIPRDRPRDAVFVPRAMDLEWENDETLVIARLPGESFVRYRMTPRSVELMLPMAARGYDGMGIVRTPDGRIGFNTPGGFRLGVAARVHYSKSGTVTSYRLDSGEYQTAWGRIFLDACIPGGTTIHVSCVTSDEALDEPALPRTLPANLLSATIRRPDLSPPMPPLSLVEGETEWLPLHRRESGRELAWVYPEQGESFITYEAPVRAEPGRYLWIRFRLKGTSRISPRLRSVRVEHPGHDYLRRLPKTFSRDPADADFLRRYLALFHGLMGELENRAAHRDILLDPHGTPEDMLPWLASFLGLTLDDRLSAEARRTLIAEAMPLFRLRGTIRSLSRMLEIYLGDPVVILEHFRLRGMGGAIVGETGPVESRAVVGGGFRVGGAISDLDSSPLEGSAEDAFELNAHRFSVLIQGSLSREQLDVVSHVLDVHRPAHTIVDVCTLGSGMRVGRGLHVGISSGIGRTGGFRTLQVGAGALGRGGIIGRPEVGVVTAASRLGYDSRVG